MDCYELAVRQGVRNCLRNGTSAPDLGDRRNQAPARLERDLQLVLQIPNRVVIAQRKLWDESLNVLPKGVTRIRIQRKQRAQVRRTRGITRVLVFPGLQFVCKPAGFFIITGCDFTIRFVIP